MAKLHKEDYFDDSIPDFAEDLPKKARNIGTCHQPHQVVIDSNLPIPPVHRDMTGKRKSAPKMGLRTYDAIYILKPNQSTFYAPKEGQSLKILQSLMRGAAHDASKWIRGETQYVTRTIIENGVKGVRIWRTK